MKFRISSGVGLPPAKRELNSTPVPQQPKFTLPISRQLIQAKWSTSSVPRNWQEWMPPNVTKVLNGPMTDDSGDCFWLLLACYTSPRGPPMSSKSLSSSSLSGLAKHQSRTCAARSTQSLRNLFIASGHKQCTSTSFSDWFTSILNILNILEAFSNI